MGWAEEQLLECLGTSTSWTHEAVREVDKKGEAATTSEIFENKKDEAAAASATLETGDEAFAERGSSDGGATAVAGQKTEAITTTPWPSRRQ